MKLVIYQACLLFMLYLGYGFYYFTRKSVTFMMPHFDRNTTNSITLTKNDIGIIISLQNLSYGLSKFAGGILSDLISCRILFGAGLFLSGLLNIGFKKDIQVYSIYLLSLLVGLVQGPAWPCCGKLLRNWLPKTQFGTFWSILSTSANLAGALGPIVATGISLRYHWTYGFMIPGCVCMSVGYLAILVIRNKPSEIGFDDFEEDQTVQDQDTEFENESDEEQEEELGRWKKMKLLFSHSFFVCVCLSYFSVMLIKTLFSDWSQIYLSKSVRIDSYTASYFVSLFEFSGIFGSIFSGILTDTIYRYQIKSNQSKQSTTDPIRIRSLTNLIYFAGLLITMHLFNYHVNQTSSSLLLYSISALSGFFCYGQISLLGIMAMEYTSNSFSGTSHGVASLAANLGAIVAGLPFGLISKFYSWNFAFKCVEYSSLFVLSFILIFRNASTKFDESTRAKKTN